jgi:uncharacterized delta-60 repeat protein
MTSFRAGRLTGTVMSLLTVAFAPLAALADSTSPDVSFDSDGYLELALTGSNGGASIVQQASGKLLVGGKIQPSGGSQVGYVLRLNAGGTLDTTYASGGTWLAPAGSDAGVMDLVQQADGKLLALIGSFAGGVPQRIARLTEGGVLDTTYAGDGIADITDPTSGAVAAVAIALQPSDGRAVVLANGNALSPGYTLFRLSTSGTLDTTFGAAGNPGFAKVTLGANASTADLVVQADGKIVVVGGTGGANGDMYVARFNANGTPDTGFDGDGVATVEFDTFPDFAEAVRLQPDGRIVVAGHAYANASRPDCAMVRFNANGSLDSTFGTGGKERFVRNSLSMCEAITLLGDGRIVATGTWQPNTFHYFMALRVTADGRADTTFVNGVAYEVYEFPPTTVISNYHADHIVQSDGKIAVVGQIDGARTGVLRLAVTGNAPSAFSFTDQVNVERSTVITSNVVTIAGLSAAGTVTVTGGEYRINAGSFTTASGSVNNGDTVQVRHTSAATFGTATNTTLTISGVSDTFTSTTVAADTTPDAFTFTDQAGVATGSVVTSNSVTIAGINSPAPISVTGGEYSINGGAFTATAGTVASGNTVQVRHTAASAVGTAVNTTLTVGGVSDTFTSTTAAADTTPDAFSFTAQTGATAGAVVTSSSITVAGINSPAAISITGGEYSVNGGAYTAAGGTVSVGNTVAVRVTASSTAGAQVTATLTIGGVSGAFNVTTAAATQPPVTVTSSRGGGGGIEVWTLLALAGLLLQRLPKAGRQRSQR